MTTKRQILQELQRRIDAAKARNDFRAVELYTLTALRVQETRDLAVAGIAKRIAATDALIPLMDRIGGAR